MTPGQRRAASFLDARRLRAQQCGSRQAVLRWNGRSASGEVDGHLCIDDESCHTSTFAWTAGVRLPRLSSIRVTAQPLSARTTCIATDADFGGLVRPPGPRPAVAVEMNVPPSLHLAREPNHAGRANPTNSSRIV